MSGSVPKIKVEAEKSYTPIKVKNSLNVDESIQEVQTTPNIRKIKTLTVIKCNTYISNIK